MKRMNKVAFGFLFTIGVLTANLKEVPLEWNTSGAVAKRAEGDFSPSGDKGGMAWSKISLGGEAVGFSAEVNTRSTEWTALALGGSWGDQFFQKTHIWVTVRPTGDYEIYLYGLKRIGSGKIPAFAATNRVDIYYSTKDGELWVWLNREVVFKNFSVRDAGFSPNIDSVGLKFLGKDIQPGLPSVSKISVWSGQIDPKKWVSARPEGFFWKPVSFDSFYTTPLKNTVLRFQILSNDTGENYEYRLSDFSGKDCGGGRTAIPSEGFREVSVSLPQGYFEISFPVLREVFGLSVQPDFSGKADPFFGLDAVVSQLVKDTESQTMWIKLMKRFGIAIARERLSANRLNPENGRWDFSFGRLEWVREEYARAGIPVLDMSHESLRWAGDEGDRSVATNLFSAFGFWSGLAARWGKYWGGVEIWNEVDQAEYNGNRTPDQYASLYKTALYAVSKNGVNPVRVALAPFTHRVKESYIDDLGRNGAFDGAGLFDFHLYEEPGRLGELVADYRKWLKPFGREGMPIWVTESGFPWTASSLRPSQAESLRSALGIVLLSVESRANGVERHFPFVLPYYSEINRNFSMTDKANAPLRSLDAYRQLISALSGRVYAGDFPLPGSGFAPARVFKGDQDLLFILTTGLGGGKDGRTAQLSFTPKKSAGLDGRIFENADPKKIPLNDGLAYVWADLSLGSQLDTKTEAMRLTSLAAMEAGTAPEKKKISPPSPIVLQFQNGVGLDGLGASGYRVTRENLKGVPLRIRVHNFSASEDDTVEITGRERNGKWQSGPVQVKAPAPGAAGWNTFVNLENFYSAKSDETLFLDFQAKSANGVSIAPLSIRIVLERNLTDLLKAFSKFQKVGMVRVTGEVPSGATYGAEISDGKLLADLDVRNGKARWGRLRIRPSEGPSGFSKLKGLVLLAKVEGNAGVFVGVTDDGAEYNGPSGAFAPGGWHAAFVPMDSWRFLRPTRGGGEKPLSPEKISLVDLTLLSFTHQNHVEISELYWVGE